MIGTEFKNDSRDSDHAPVRGGLSPRLRFDTFYLRAKFDDSSFSRSRYIIGGVKIKSGSCDPDHAL